MSAISVRQVERRRPEIGLLLSVVVPTHNVEPWIDELLASILRCTFTSMEVIVVDDHSSDGTDERLADLAASDPRVHIVRAHGRGGAGARNTGLAVARGEYVAFADGDDIVPAGAYERLVGSLEKTGSDIAFGDWLKFSSIKTWQPSKNWRVFDEERPGVALTEVPALIRGRAVWNKVFRRSFLQEIGLRFPEVARSNDIFPMTRSYLTARTIDVLPDCVYLYRDRPGTGSMTARAGADAAAVSYFTQESACAELISAYDDAGVAKTYSSLVFDADAWLHLSRFLRATPAERVRSSGALSAVERLIAATPHWSLPVATPHKQVLWCLVAAGELEAAVRFNELEERARERDVYDDESFNAWVDSLEIILARPDVLEKVPRARLLVEGLATLLLHHAHDVDRRVIDALTDRVARAGLFSQIDPGEIKRGPVRQIVLALRAGTTGAAWLISTSIRTRLVAEEVVLDRGGALLSGPSLSVEGVRLTLIARPQGAGPGSVRLLPQTSTDRWAVRVPAGSLALGRWDLVGELAIGDATVEVPVVTARMQLPVPERTDRIRVLSDRARSWRVVLERRRAATSRAALTVVRRVVPRR
ncbi:glycosyltransferase family 2 protein [Curtobacterium sp. AB451]|uniref:glycosyltransferase family 2 protein n=1 Tax=Curtobacterium sp. AB451 TaxID=3422306 RepID=UPI003D358C5E